VLEYVLLLAVDDQRGEKEAQPDAELVSEESDCRGQRSLSFSEPKVPPKPPCEYGHPNNEVCVRACVRACVTNWLRA
jgi:hypothetical protein